MDDLAPLGIVLAVVVVAVLGGLVLGSCGGVNQGVDPEAQQLQARAELARAQAEADSERAATRQMERDAAHERALEVLPYVVAIGGGLVVLVLAVVFGALMWQRQAAGGGAGRASAPPILPPPVQVFVLPAPMAGQRRAEYWRQVEASATGRMVGAGNGLVRVIEEDEEQ